MTHHQVIYFKELCCHCLIASVSKENKKAWQIINCCLDDITKTDTVNYYFYNNILIRSMMNFQKYKKITVISHYILFSNAYITAIIAIKNWDDYHLNKWHEGQLQLFMLWTFANCLALHLKEAKTRYDLIKKHHIPRCRMKNDLNLI